MLEKSAMLACTDSIPGSPEICTLNLAVLPGENSHYWRSMPYGALVKRLAFLSNRPCDIRSKAYSVTAIVVSDDVFLSDIQDSITSWVQDQPEPDIAFPEVRGFTYAVSRSAAPSEVGKTSAANHSEGAR